MSLLREFSNSPMKASDIIGTRVVNPKGDNLGDIKEIVIDPHTGKVAYAVVSFGGFLSLGEKLFAIPFSALEYSVKKPDLAPGMLIQSEYILHVSKEKLEAAPGFDTDHWPLLSDEKWHRTMHTYYGLSPFWE